MPADADQTLRQLRDLCDVLFKRDKNVRRYDTMFLLDNVKTGSALPSELLPP
ncbi:hypothetical protein [Amycolatopsis sp. YIM 10]|uniref:hypothetical protein n=1 Tax=Amycolatopsis sp. YIM 10 TaxID=2653857 RepID=UPI0012900A86|nr:hypothetical protein [Amycolatopsis sp. YIM 10]QFU91953.1 hypothetical protein YIM_33960 [Amycolatopsis sp. YIM 10]